MNAAKFYWAVVGDASPEPVAVVEEGGKRVAYTCGCPDPFDVDGPDARIQLVHVDRTPAGYVTGHFRNSDGKMVIRREEDDPEPLEIPMKPADAAGLRAERERELKRDRERGIRHGHRRFNP